MNKKATLFETLAHGIVKGRWIICALFAALIVFSVFSVRWIKVENDITAYLPEEAEARRGLTIMNEEFTTLGTAKVMVHNISQEQAEALVDVFSEIENVVLVNYDDTQAHYKDGSALIDLTFGDKASSEASHTAMKHVEAAVSDYDTTIYTSVGYSIAAVLAEQMAVVLVFVVIVVLAVLLFTSSTYAEIPVMILTFLAAAIINMGTAFLMGTISFVSNSVSVVMQLALSVDYAIIFCNRYKEEHETLGIKEAMEKALAASIPEIFASSLTTIAGLIAMTFMKFRLGADLGFNLVKAVAISLLTVFLFMPALLMLFGKAMDKTKHKRFVPKISFVGKFAYATRHVMPILLVLLVLGAYYVCGRIDYAYAMEAVPARHMTEHETAQAEIHEAFGSSNLVALLVPSGDYAAEKALLNELEACDEVKSATGIAAIEVMDGLHLGDKIGYRDFCEIADLDETTAQALFAYYAAAHGEHSEATEDLENYRVGLLDLFLFLHDHASEGGVELTEEQSAMIDGLYSQLSMLKSQLQSEEHSRLVLDLNMPVQSEETFAFLSRIHAIAARYYDGDVVLTGDSVSAKDFKDSFASDNRVVGLMSIVMVMVILFFTFKSFGMPLLLILVIQGSIWMNFGIAALQGTPIFFLCYLIVGSIQMGANIDYAIVVSSRYQEFRETMDRREAIIETLNIAFPTIITSGLMMVCAGLLIGFRVSQCIIAGMGYYVGTGTSISLVLILFALPQVLLLGDRFVAATSVGRNGHAAPGFFARNRRSLAVALMSIALVLAILAVPFGMATAGNYSDSVQRRSEEKLKQIERLRSMALRVEETKAAQGDLSYAFAEQLMTDKIGSEQLKEGEEQYQEGLEQYNEGKAQYDEGAAQLADAESAYAAGAAQLAQGQAEYDAGLAQYNAGKAALAEGSAQLAQGQAEYDAGLAQYNEGQAQVAAAREQLAQGQAEYDAGLAQYNEGKAALDSVAPLYQSAVALRNRVYELQAQYDAALASGDIGEAIGLSAVLTAAQIAADATDFNGLLAQYEAAQAELAAGEAQLAAGKAQLDEGYAQLAAAEAQLRDAEAQLAQGKAELDAGYAAQAAGQAQLRDAEAQLAQGRAALDAGYGELNAGGEQIYAGRAQLADAEAQLKEGEAQLKDAEAQLEEGRETLEQNRENLSDSIEALDALRADEAELDEALKQLRGDPALAGVLRRNAGALESIDEAAAHYRAAADSARTQEHTARILAILLAAAALLGLLGLLLGVKWTRFPAILTALSVLLAAITAILWNSRCTELAPWVLLAAVLLAVAGALNTMLLIRGEKI